MKLNNETERIRGHTIKGHMGTRSADKIGEGANECTVIW